MLGGKVVTAADHLEMLTPGYTKDQKELEKYKKKQAKEKATRKKAREKRELKKLEKTLTDIDKSYNNKNNKTKKK